MLTSLKIERFRGIPSLTLKDLGRVNVFIGENGAGKTTVLEAVYLAAFPTSPGRLLSLGQHREMPSPNLDSTDSLDTLFFNGDLSQGPRFEFSIRNQPPHQLAVNSLQNSGFEDLGEYPLEPSAFANSPVVHGIEVKYTPSDGKPDGYKLTLHRLPSAIRVSAPPRNEGGIGCYPIPARWANSVQDTASALTWLIETKRPGTFLKMLQAVDPRVADIKPGSRGGSPVVLVDVGLPTMLPINVLGDGLCRVALLTTGLFAGGAQLLAVDEIDSGLHYSAMAGVWRGICELVKQEDKQIFCTTHNEEMLARTLDAFADAPELLRVFRLDRMKDGRIEAALYGYDLLGVAERTAVEIR
jgi:hypothetical protein